MKKNKAKYAPQARIDLDLADQVEMRRKYYRRSFTSEKQIDNSPSLKAKPKKLKSTLCRKKSPKFLSQLSRLRTQISRKISETLTQAYTATKR